MSEFKRIYTEDEQKYIDAARLETDDDLEIDDTPELSQADEGCWVAAWIWVSNSDAGIKDAE